MMTEQKSMQMMIEQRSMQIMTEQTKEHADSHRTNKGQRKQHADEGICGFSIFSGQLVSLLQCF